MNDKLYHKDSGGVLAQAISFVEAKEEVDRLDKLSSEKMTSTFIEVCRGKAIIGLKRLKMLLRYTWP